MPASGCACYWETMRPWSPTMTEPGEPRRIDLRALDDSDPEQAARVVRAALARAKLGGGALLYLAARARPILAAAALVFLAAYLLLRLAPLQAAPEEPAQALAEWVAAGHVPSNGEIVATFQGYRP